MRTSLTLARVVSCTLLALSTACGSASAVETSPWTPVATLSSCAGNSAPQIVFPSDKPNHATGPGAIVWSAGAGCPGGQGARVARVAVADIPLAPVVPGSAAGRPLAPRGPLSVSAGPRGRIVIAGSSPQTPGDSLVVQGRSSGPFAPLWNIHGSTSPLALGTGYLGDVALAAPPAVGSDDAGLRVGVERFFSHELAVREPASTWGTRSATALTVALDYRTDALAVWAQAGSLWAHDLPASGTVQPVQRLATVYSSVRVATLLSDDNQATVAWSQESAGVTSVYMERSSVGVRFAKPKLLERFANPDGLADPQGSPRLVRLSSESVMMAWAGAAGGHWVIHTAAIDFRGIGATATVAAPGSDALLADLAPGPDGNALLLWTEPQRNSDGAAEIQRQAIFAARAIDLFPDITSTTSPEELAAPGPYTNPTGALDPASNRAVVAWRGEDGTIQYAVRSPPSASS